MHKSEMRERMIEFFRVPMVIRGWGGIYGSKGKGGVPSWKW